MEAVCALCEWRLFLGDGFLRHKVTWTVTNPIISSINKPLANRRGALFMDLFFRDGTDDKPPTISLNFVLFRAACSVAPARQGRSRIRFQSHKYRKRRTYILRTLTQK